jgi:hypothetical protein
MQREFRYQTPVSAPADAVFEWYTRPGALERLTPGTMTFEVLERQGDLQSNGRVAARIKKGPLSLKWVAQHSGFDRAQRRFADTKIGGIVGWEHIHSVLPDNSGGCILDDRIQYRIPGFPIGWILDYAMRRDMARVFRFRHTLLALDIQRHLAAPRRSLRIGVTGATGLVGSALCAFLSTGGHRVIAFSRPGRPAPGFLSESIEWDPQRGATHPAQLEGFDAIVHLAGENIASRRWSARQKALIRDSRVEGTKTIAGQMAACKNPPRVFVCASAIGYYGDRRDEVLSEQSAAGLDFLAGVCQEWESAGDAARHRGIRTVHMRFGIILSAAGGALRKMLMPFRMGAGGRIGSGDQWMSWISLYDAVAALHHAIVNESVVGPVNAVSPAPVTNLEFTKTLGRVLRRPTIAPLPAGVVSLAFGEMGESLLLGSQRVVPERLQATRFAFAHPELEGALRFELGL